MRFEWDDDKNRANRAKYGISFEEAAVTFAGPVLTAPDQRPDYGEERFISYGHLSSTVAVAIVHTRRDGYTRLISARKANQKERRAYHERVKEAAP